MAGKHDQIADHLIQDILSGRYRVSERLPSERDLAARFDANRGAVREAMKKLEQIGLAEVQPGGARVKDCGEASLDVIGYMMAQGDLPDASLVDQIMVVVNNLLSDAAEQAMDQASDDEIAEIRALLQPLMCGGLDEESHLLARFELMKAIMLASRNLPLRLVTRTLIEQMSPNLEVLHPFASFDEAPYRLFARQLNDALAQRDKQSMRVAFTAFSNLNRETVMRAMASARDSVGQEAISQ